GILRTCADQHPDVLKFPEPGAVFEDFADSALIFSLRVSLPDIGKAVAVQSALRTAIFKALRAANIEIPFNQIDVNLRDLDGARRYPAQRAADAERRPQARPTPPARDQEAAAAHDHAGGQDRGNGKPRAGGGD